MTWLRNSIAFLALLALLFLLFNLNFSVAENEIVSCSTEQVTGVSFHTSKDFQYARDAVQKSIWQLSFDQQLYKAENDAVLKHAYLLCHLTYEEYFIVDDTPASLAPYGLTPDAKNITLHFAHDRQPLTLTLGEKTPSTFFTYLTSSREPGKVYVVKNSALKQVTPDLLSLLSRRIFFDFNDGMLQLKHNFEGYELTLEARNDVWSSTLPVPAAELRELATLLKSFVIAEYDGPLSTADLEEKGYAFADLELQWHDQKTGQTSVYKFNKMGGSFGIFFELGGETYVYYLNAGAAKAFYVKLQELSAKYLFPAQ